MNSTNKTTMVDDDGYDRGDSPSFGTYRELGRFSGMDDERERYDGRRRSDEGEECGSNLGGPDDKDDEGGDRDDGERTSLGDAYGAGRGSSRDAEDEGDSVPLRESQSETRSPLSRRDVILSLKDDFYKEIMWRHFRTLGVTKDLDREAKAARDAYRWFRSRMGEHGKFFKPRSRARDAANVEVGDGKAFEKIRTDIRRRLDSRRWMETRDEWSRRSKVATTEGFEEIGNDSLVRYDAPAVAATSRTNSQNNGKRNRTVAADISTKDGLADDDRGRDPRNAKAWEDTQDVNGEVTAKDDAEELEAMDHGLAAKNNAAASAVQHNAAAALTSCASSLNKDGERKETTDDASLKIDLADDNHGADYQNQNAMEGAPKRVDKIMEEEHVANPWKNSEEKKTNKRGEAYTLGNGKKIALASKGVDQDSVANSTIVSTETTKGQTSTSNNPSSASKKEQPSPLQVCSTLSFNQTLKAALDTYHTSHTLLKSSNNPPPPKPPPFLSHQEECTLKTALAFVMAKAQLSNNEDRMPRDHSRSSMNANDGGVRALNEFLFGRKSNYSLNSARGSMTGMGLAAGTRHGLGNNRLRSSTMRPAQKVGDRTSCLLGGLLSLPPPSSCGSIVPKTPNNHSTANNASLVLDRKLKHVRDVLKLAVSSVLPLYRGALEKRDCGNNSNDAGSFLDGSKDDGDSNILPEEKECADGGSNGNDGNSAPVGRRPCAVYDYESAVQPSIVLENTASSLPQCTVGLDHHRRHHATLDGLCHHVIERLSALIREEELKRGKLHGVRRAAVAVVKESRVNGTGGREKEQFENDENQSNANGSVTVVTNKSRDESNSSNATLKQGISNNNFVRDAIAKLIHNDLIGDAYLHGLPRSSTLPRPYHPPTRWNSSVGIVRECAEHRIEKTMAVCHVLHRLLFLDKSCSSSLGTEVVVTVCSILSDLYGNRYSGIIVNDHVEQDSTTHDDGESKSSENASSNNSKHDTQPNRNNNSSREKHQVVSSRWGVVPSSLAAYINDRHERRCRAVDMLSQHQRQRWSNSSNSNGQSHFGSKRRHNDNTGSNERAATNESLLPLPCIGHVLTVNLLRLLEGAAAIRLHHRQQAVVHPSSYSSSSRGGDRQYMLDRVASVAATEVLTEIRSTVNPRELVLPLYVGDAAKFYYNDKMCRTDGIRSGGAASKTNYGALVILGPGAKMMLRLHLFDLMNKLALYEHV